MNLIPDKSPANGSYWCTWDTQWNVLKERLPAGSPIPTRDAMNEEFLFSPEGVLNSFEGMRGDLIVVLDDGWDVPYGAADSRLFGSLAADPERFPSLHGTPAERLRQLLDRRLRAPGLSRTGPVGAGAAADACGWKGTQPDHGRGARRLGGACPLVS